jgi:alpha-L-arabinofuranosidase
MTEQARVKIDLDRAVGRRDPMIFGHFLEHFHRQVYGGVFDPGSPLSDEHGFRVDVIAALRRIRVPILRWPGGCFVSAYHWKDGVGEQAPVWDKAWRVEEPNTFGTDEYVAFCRQVGAEPYICTNAGSGSSEEMSDWVEYCNLAEAGRWARLRRANGHPEPHRVRYWSIGNENYGAWEIGAKTADEWGRFVAESAKMMKRADGSIEIAVASVADLDWNAKLLKEAGRYLDWVSIHGYWGRSETPYEVCVAHSGYPEKQIQRMEHVLGALRMLGTVRIAFDEWNLRGWHHPSFLAKDPNVQERDQNDDNSTYTMADAVFASRFLNTCLRHCTTVGMANFSPVVNTRGAIFTHGDGLVLRSTYHVFDLYANHTGPEVLDVWVDSPFFMVDEQDAFRARDWYEPVARVPYLDATATFDRQSRLVSVAMTNLHADAAVACRLELSGATAGREATVRTLNGATTSSYNDIEHPNDIDVHRRVVTMTSNALTVELEPHSVTIVSLPVGGDVQKARMGSGQLS